MLIVFICSLSSRLIVTITSGRIYAFLLCMNLILNSISSLILKTFNFELALYIGKLLDLVSQHKLFHPVGNTLSFNLFWKRETSLNLLTVVTSVIFVFFFLSPTFFLLRLNEFVSVTLLLILFMLMTQT